MATILSHVPVIKGFRSIYKAIYVLPALFVFIAAMGFSVEIKRKWASFLILIICILFLGEQIYECKRAVRAPYPNYGYEYLNDVERFDRSNYRVLYVSSDSDNHELIDVVPYANANITAGIQTVGGYELTSGHLDDSMKKLYADVEWVGLSGSNAVQVGKLLTFFDADESNLQEFAEALKKNSIGYILSRDSDLSLFLEKLNEEGIEYECIYKNEENGVVIYQLKDIPSIVTDSDLTSVDIVEMGMDYLKIDTASRKDAIHVNERYNPHLKAYSVESGRQKELSITKEENGITIDLDGEVDTVLLTYQNPIYLAAVYLSPVYLILAVFLLILKSRSKSRQI